ncbi:N-acetyl-gamma-glutamyl-phosphate reductase [Liquorilactobacillus capillatus]|nr:N-acetyl-gamma-glutamyl-phosphate reductase [Liquorilactobacillus capillatus]
MKVGLLGATGYSGAVLYSLLKQHPNVTHLNLYGHNTGTSKKVFLETAIPAYLNEHLELQEFDPVAIMNSNDVLFCATPAGVTSKIARPFIEENFPVIDLSGDFRFKDPAVYSKWYHKPAAPAEQLQKACYGLTDFQTPTTHYIANPGCYATASLLGLAPLVIEKMIIPDTIIIDAKSGVSGAGKKPNTSNNYSFINENAWLYKMNQHQHIPEIVQQLQAWNKNISAIEFTTTLIPITRGIMATIYVKAAPNITLTKIKQAFNKYYQHDKFIRLLPEETPSIKEVTGSNYCNIGLSYNEVTNTIVIVSVIDNLMKGAAGQALQNFNQLFNFPEEAGLPLLPLFP